MERGGCSGGSVWRDSDVRKEQDIDNKVIEIVRSYIVDHLDKSDKMPEFDVFVVWKCKALQNWKYLLSSTLFDGMYYEMTYNGDKKEWQSKVKPGTT